MTNILNAAGIGMSMNGLCERNVILMLYCVVPENIHTPPTKGFLFCNPLPPPGNSSLASYFASKIVAFKTPLPLGILYDLPWVGMDFFYGTGHYHFVIIYLPGLKQNITFFHIQYMY